jgi:hypothetical protein
MHAALPRPTTYDLQQRWACLAATSPNGTAEMGMAETLATVRSMWARRLVNCIVAAGLMFCLFAKGDRGVWKVEISVSHESVVDGAAVLYLVLGDPSWNSVSSYA